MFSVLGFVLLNFLSSFSFWNKFQKSRIFKKCTETLQQPGKIGQTLKKKKLTIILQSVRKCCTNFAIWYEYFGCFEDFMRLWHPAFQFLLLCYLAFPFRNLFGLIMKLIQWNLEVAVRRCSVKKVFWKIWQNSEENTCARVSFLKKFQAWSLQLY